MTAPRADATPTEGERWASAELTSLRLSRYGLPAWVRFLAASFRRAAATRRARRPLARQAVRWSAASAITTSVLRRTVACRAGRPLSTRGLAAWWLALVLMLDWHLGMVEGIDGQPREKLSLADALTLSRAAAAPFAASAPPDTPLYLTLLAFAGVTDLLDGRLARRRGPTRFGRDFDALADLAFREAALRGARRAGWLSPGPIRVLAARQTLLVCGSAWSWFGHAQRPPLDETRLARWDAPPLIAGLALAALGRRRAGAILITVAAIVGGAALLRTTRARPTPVASR
ncbi:MAG: CDP-alcohol phosphatidyltransferase family protein [Actinomycetota bacterium]|nr:CDP-alcohol phosphatidyltransferase family protein [Actinomycetota bacterium]